MATEHARVEEELLLLSSRHRQEDHALGSMKIRSSGTLGGPINTADAMSQYIDPLKTSDPEISMLLASLKSHFSGGDA
jgi:hypothetical protein